eukprot:Opistho-1_new@24702
MAFTVEDFNRLQEQLIELKTAKYEAELREKHVRTELEQLKQQQHHGPSGSAGGEGQSQAAQKAAKFFQAGKDLFNRNKSAADAEQAAALAAAPPPADPAAAAARITELQRHLDDATKASERQKAQLEEAQKATDKVKRELEEATKEKQAAQSRVSELQKQLDEANKQSEKRKNMIDEISIQKQELIARQQQQQLQAERQLAAKVEESNAKAAAYEERLRHAEDVRVQLQRDLDKARAHVEELKADKSALEARLSDQRAANEALEKQRTEENAASAAALEAMTKERDEVKAQLEGMQREVEDVRSERALAEKKGVQLMKDLKRQLQVEKAKSERLQNELNQLNGYKQTTHSHSPDDVPSRSSMDLESSSSSRRTSVDIARNSMDGRNVNSLVDDNKTLIKRCTELQAEKASLAEKIKFLEDTNAALADDVTRQSKLIRAYAIETFVGDDPLDPSAPKRKSILAKAAGAVSHVPGVSQAAGAVKKIATGDGAKDKARKEAQRKLQLALEEAMAKNVALQEQVETMDAELRRAKRKAAD